MLSESTENLVNVLCCYKINRGSLAQVFQNKGTQFS